MNRAFISMVSRDIREGINHYSGSKEIIKLINEKVRKENPTNWSRKFLRRKNGIININVSLEVEKSIQYINLTVRI